ncbi:unnamed protein product, partial [Meganyctiphanes norvegica]
IKTQTQSGRYGDFQNIVPPEIRLTDSITILMGIVKMPVLPFFWSTDEIFDYSYIRNVMRRDRFLQIYGSLHFSDAISALEANDNLYKIRKLCNMYKEVFKNNYCPGRELSVDESLELWKSERFRLRVSIPREKKRRDRNVSYM